MTRIEYAQAKIKLESLYDNISHTSGVRSIEHNENVGGSARSKHLYGMADDYIFDISMNNSLEEILQTELLTLGFWFKLYPDDRRRFHIQGLPTGDIPEWWLEQEGE